jgi:acetyl-CoA carboxylase biotin carboxyl carrier protein
MENTEKELEWVKRLSQTMVENQLHKLEFETENVSLTLRATIKAPVVQAAPATTSLDSEDVEEADVVLIKSKDVGLFSRNDELKPGVRIEKGQKLGSVEAVSVEHDLVAEYSGTLVEVLVQDGDPVEYGQPLFVLSESEG